MSQYKKLHISSFRGIKICGRVHPLLAEQNQIAVKINLKVIVHFKNGCIFSLFPDRLFIQRKTVYYRITSKKWMNLIKRLNK
jgi:hypothetical protein